MSMRIRAAVGPVFLVCAWSCQVRAGDLPTIYSPLPEPDRADVKLSHGDEPCWWDLPSPQGRALRLEGQAELERECIVTSLCLWGAEGPPEPDFDYPLGGGPGHPVPSYFHMATKGAAVIVGFELALMGVMMALPREAMKWEPDFVQDAVHNLGDHLTSAPVWDQDDWMLNYVGHPYAGSIYYNTVRAQGASPWQSFLFAFGASTFWEYVVEGTAEPASAQDLIVTPVGGALVGELVHQLTLQLKKGGTNVLEGIVITILNPTHVAMKGYH